MGEATRLDRQHNETGTFGPTTPTPSTGIPAAILGSRVTGLDMGDTSHSKHFTNVELVEKQRKHQEGCIISTIPASSVNLHGCQSGGLRSNIGVTGDIGVMDADRSRDALQQQGDVGSNKGSSTLQDSYSESDGFDMLGQYHNSGHNKQSGRDQVMAADRHGSTAVDSTGLPELQGLGSPRARQAQCLSGPTLKEATSHINGVEDTTRHSDPNMAEVGHSTIGPVCNQMEQSVTSVCLTDTRHSSMGSECSGNIMEEPVCVRIPAMGDTEPSSVKTAGGSGRNDPDSSKMGDTTMVQPPTRSTNRHSSRTSKARRSTKSKSLRRSTQQSTHASSTCLEVIREANKKKGFSPAVATRLGKGVKPSTRGVYDYKWLTFVKWAESQHVKSPTKATVPTICNFLEYLFTEKGLQVNTIRGYRASVCRVIKLVNSVDYSEDSKLNALIKSFLLDRPRTIVKFPKWDLILVLDALRTAPYEPLSAISMINLSKKTLFLLALASGARRNELHALDLKETLSIEDGKAFILKPAADFVAKNHNLHTNQGQFEGFKIVSLSDYAGPDLKEENKLCPVRALKYYLNRTKEKRCNISKLFITCNHTGLARVANKNTLSSWIKHLVADVYQTTTDSKSSVLHRAMHEVRAVAASVAQYSNVAMEDIMAQCRWKQATTFTSCYIRDIKSVKDQLYCLPPIMAAGAILDPLNKGQ